MQYSCQAAWYRKDLKEACLGWHNQASIIGNTLIWTTLGRNMQAGLTSSLILQAGVFLLLVVMSIVRTVRTRSILKGGLFAYGMLVTWGVLFCLLVPGILVAITGDKGVWELFPEGPGLVAIVVLGWIYGFLLAAITTGVYAVVVRSTTTTRNTDLPAGSNQSSDDQAPNVLGRVRPNVMMVSSVLVVILLVACVVAIRLFGTRQAAQAKIALAALQERIEAKYSPHISMMETLMLTASNGMDISTSAMKQKLESELDAMPEIFSAECSFDGDSGVIMLKRPRNTAGCAYSQTILPRSNASTRRVSYAVCHDGPRLLLYSGRLPQAPVYKDYKIMFLRASIEEQGR